MINCFKIPKNKKDFQNYTYEILETLFELPSENTFIETLKNSVPTGIRTQLFVFYKFPWSCLLMKQSTDQEHGHGTQYWNVHGDDWATVTKIPPESESALHLFPLHDAN